VRTIVTSTNGRMRFEGIEGTRVKKYEWEDDDEARMDVLLDMSPEDVLDFIREAGRCIVDIEPKDYHGNPAETLTIEVYNDYRE
jgi:hypothetical protein